MILHAGQTPILIPSDGSPPQIVTDLDQKELAAIGMLVVQWSSLEHAMYEKSVQLCHMMNDSLPDKAVSRPFKDRLGALHKLAKKLPDSMEKTKLMSLVGKVANMENKRHKICHGLWTWDICNPDYLLVESRRHPFVFETSTEFDDLIELSLKIGEMIYQLKYSDQDPIDVVARCSENGFLNRAFRRSVRPDEPPNPTSEPRNRKRRKGGRAL